MPYRAFQLTFEFSGKLPFVRQFDLGGGALFGVVTGTRIGFVFRPNAVHVYGHGESDVWGLGYLG